ncbi:hypothetical protein [Emergencia sp. 1XD21-10]|uniref:hypothetical protein n=1 Tax=Emergencia sp. 1XD21-10 TaxID=2304569 RepID=UPI0013798BCB|nr:hypothetical protein [Emergencia sp. 1XD21-10]
MARIWTKVNRKNLEFYLKEGYMVPRIAEKMGVSAQAIYGEIKKTLTEEEYRERRYVKYSAERAIAKEISQIQGEE